MSPSPERRENVACGRLPWTRPLTESLARCSRLPERLSGGSRLSPKGTRSRFVLPNSRFFGPPPYRARGEGPGRSPHSRKLWSTGHVPCGLYRPPCRAYGKGFGWLRGTVFTLLSRERVTAVRPVRLAPRSRSRSSQARTCRVSTHCFRDRARRIEPGGRANVLPPTSTKRPQLGE